jgi:streptomycin 6-kinase
MLSSCKHLSDLTESLLLLKGHLESATLAKAVSLFRDLSADRTQDVLLHGDLHHDNILNSDSSWKVIDPHGYIGDPAAEVGVMIRNPIDCFPTDKPLKKIIERRLKILSEMLPFDPKKIQAWAFCLTILSAAWDFEGYGRIPKETIKIALVVDKIVF